MRKYLFPAAVVSGTAFLECLFPPISSAQSTKSAYYWVSHGSPIDPVWTLFLQGAQLAAFSGTYKKHDPKSSALKDFKSQYGKITKGTKTETLTEVNEGNEGLSTEKRRD